MRAGLKSYLPLFALIFAGEAVFSLPFHIPRFFRPTMLDAFELSNTELGDAFAAYGVLAMVAYLVGGPQADKYPPRTLLFASLLGTALGGLLLAQMPSSNTLFYLYAYWGLTTVLLFWSPLIRATRDWGGALAQGRAFGLLEGGRGLMAASSASCAVFVFSLLLPDSTAAVDVERSRAALQAVVYLYTAITVSAALMVWFCLPGGQPVARSSTSSLESVRQVIRKPVVWLHAALIICAYCAYKGLDNYGVYAVEVLGFNQLEANRFVSNAAYLRLFAALLAGLLADRIGVAKTIAAVFMLLFVCYLFLFQASLETAGLVFLVANLLATFFAAFAVRGLYFALLEEVKTPVHLTGTTVGLVSVLGYTPDVFYYPIAGRILDSASGLVGHQLHFAFLASIMLLGLLLSFLLMFLNHKQG